MPTLPPELDSKYEVLCQLGSGGMGAVFKVRHRYLDEIQVIKLMHTSLANSEDLRSRFVREARLAKQLRHQNIAEVIDFSVTTDGSAYIVLEFIEGIDLRQMLSNAARPLEWQFVSEVAVQTLSVLGFLHGRGYVHRDISPDNLMLTRRADGTPLIKLIDLGIAKAIEGEAGRPATLAGNFLGKLQYASPEQCGAGYGAGVDARSDLYSLGVVMYELLTKREPIGGTNPLEIIGGHASRPPLEFSVSDPEGLVPEWMRGVVLRALQKKPDDRFSSAEEFAAAIRAGLAAARRVTVAFVEREVYAGRTLEVPLQTAAPPAPVPPPPAETLPVSEPVPIPLTEAAPLRTGDSTNERRTREKWEATLESGDVPALKSFADGESGEYAVRAQRLLERIESYESAAWLEATSSGSSADFERFIRAFPRSPRVAEARAAAAAAGEYETRTRAAIQVAEAPGAAEEVIPQTVVEPPSSGAKTKPNWRVLDAATSMLRNVPPSLPWWAGGVAAGAVLLLTVLLWRARTSERELPATEAAAAPAVQRAAVVPPPSPANLLLSETIGPMIPPEPLPPIVEDEPAPVEKKKRRVVPAAPVIETAPPPVEETSEPVPVPAPAPAVEPQPQAEVATFVEGGDPAKNRDAVAALRRELTGVKRIQVQGFGDVADLIAILRRSSPGIAFSPDDGEVTIVYSGENERFGPLRKRRSAEAVVRRNGRAVFRYELKPEEYRLGDTPAEAFARVLRRALQR